MKKRKGSKKTLPFSDNRSRTRSDRVVGLTNQKEFTCSNCAQTVSRLAWGTKNRNHCPNCLHSKHVDHLVDGDRLSTCRNIMKPLALSAKPDGELMIIHQCIQCNKLHKNRIAGDDKETAIEELRQKTLDLASETRSRLKKAGLTVITDH